MELSKGFDWILHDLNIKELTILRPVLVNVSTFDYSNNKTLQTITTFSTWTNALSDLLKNYVTQTKSAIEWFTHNKMMVNQVNHKDSLLIKRNVPSKMQKQA